MHWRKKFWKTLLEFPVASTMSTVQESKSVACRICVDKDLFIFDYGYRDKPNEAEERRLSKLLSAQLFHDPCTLCQDEDSDESMLCDSSKNLRLKHLFRCVDSSRRPFKDRIIKFPRFEGVEDVERIRGRVECSFCRLVTRQWVTLRVLLWDDTGSKTGV